MRGNNNSPRDLLCTRTGPDFPGGAARVWDEMAAYLQATYSVFFSLGPTPPSASGQAFRGCGGPGLRNEDGVDFFGGGSVGVWGPARGGFCGPGYVEYGTWYGSTM